MSDRLIRDDKFAALRRQAERLLAERKGEGEWPGDIERLLHELQTAQIELELQNEELRTAQEALSQTRDRYRHLFDFSPVGYCTLTPNLTVIEANLTLAAMLASERGKLLGLSLSAFMDEEDADRLHLHCRQISTKIGLQALEARLQRSGGEWFWARLECLPEESDSGDDTAIRMAVSDVTIQRTLRDELAEGRETLGAILESSGDGLLVVGKDGRVIHSNRQFAWMWQLDDELLKSGSDEKLLYNVLPQLVNGEAFLDRVRELYGTDEEDHDTLHFKDGRIFTRYSRPLWQNGVITGRVWSFRDVTDRRRAEATLARSERRFRTLFEQAAMGAAVVEAGSGRFVEVNPAFCEITGYSAEELLARTFMAITHPDDLAAELAGMGQLEAGALRGFGMEKRYLGKDGQVVWVTLAAAPMWQEDEAPSTFVSMIEDISERKRTEAKLALQQAVLGGINRIFREALVCESAEELTRTCLAALEEVTGSRFGFIGEIGEDGRLHGHGISDSGRKACRMADRQGHRLDPGELAIHGLYGKVLQNGAPFFTNAPQAHPASIGIPSGHPAIESFLGVPLIDNGRTVGLIALANRPGGYREEDLRAVEQLSHAVVQSLARKRAEQELALYRRDLEGRVAERTQELTESNIALKVLLNRGRSERQEIEEQLATNIRGLVAPMLAKLKKSGLTARQSDYLALLEGEIDMVAAPFLHRVSTRFLGLTPTEIRVADLIRQGMSTKEIADLLHLSLFTVNIHRQNLRKKFGLSGTKQNLHSFLLSQSHSPE